MAFGEGTRCIASFVAGKKTLAHGINRVGSGGQLHFRAVAGFPASRGSLPEQSSENVCEGELATVPSSSAERAHNLSGAS